MKGITHLILLIPVLCGLSQTAPGQGVCQIRPRTTYVQQRGVVVQQVQQQQYNQQYNQVQPVVQQTIQYPVVVGVPLSDLGINYYFSVSPEQRESRIVEQVAKELLKNMNVNGYGILVPVQPQVQPAPDQQPQQPDQPQPQPDPGQQQIVIQPDGTVPQQQMVPPPPQPMPQGQQQPSEVVPPPPQPMQVVPQPMTTMPQGQMNLPASVRAQIQVTGLFQQKCMGCHKPGEIKKNIKLFNTDGSLVDNDMNARIEIVNSVLGKEGATLMPPVPKTALTTDEKRLVIQWLQEKL